MSKKIIDIARKSAAEGMVLLKNDGNILPIKSNETVSVFGRCQINYYRSGTGSGGAVNVEYTVNAIEGLSKYENIHLNKELLDTYNSWINENPFDDGGGVWAGEPWFQKEMPLTDELVRKAKEISDKAVVIIGRTAGEDKDNADVEGSYRLTLEEMNMLTHVTAYFEDVVVVLNVSNIIDMSWVNDATHKHPIKSILYAWHGGMEGGNALADILTGKIVPNGKLNNTIAYEIEDYPSNNQFGDSIKNIYEEDIYLGYRYFETFRPEAVQFAFGFGMSYTSFEIIPSTCSVHGEGLDKTLHAEVKVTNTGDLFSGKEIVQLYYSAPQGELGKPLKELGSFKKTKLLKPGETETLNLELKFSDMASFDDGGYTGNISAYVLEAGEYKFYIGNSIRSLKLIDVNEQQESILDELLIVEQLEEAMAPVQPFKRMRPGKLLDDGLYEISYEPVPMKKLSTLERMEKNKPETIIKSDDNTYTLHDVADGVVSLKEFVAQLNKVELATIVKGEGMCSPKVTAGTASAFGGISNSLQKYGIPVAASADGPSGIRMDSGQKATQVAIGTLLACTWDTDLVEELYEEVGKELVQNEIDTLLGPGLNIHRHPLNGRNFEYFSEDPIVTGLFAAAVTRGLRRGGSYATLKHFAANDQEQARHTVDAVVSERALREINLKGFEIAVKEGDAKSIMTSYNPINGIYAASNYDLNTTVLRKEWGFDGIVMTDWWAKVNHPVDGGTGNTYNKSYMVQAQNDLYMVLDNNTAENFEDDDLLLAVDSGDLSIGELQRSAMNICSFLMSSQCFNKDKKELSSKSYNANQKPKSEEVFDITDSVVLNEKANTTFTIQVQKAGEYTVLSKLRYSAESLAQAALNILINDQYAVTTPLHGTDNKWKEAVLLTINLEVGFYEVTLDFVKPGIEVGELIFSINKDK